MSTRPIDVPYLGAGIGLRRVFFDSFAASERPVDWVELLTENYMGKSGRPLRAVLNCKERGLPMVPHGVSLNIGGPDPLDDAYVDGLAEFVVQVDAPFFSDHVCYSRLGGVYLHDLLPLPFSREAADHVIARSKEVKARVPRPFLLENPSFYAYMPGGDMSESEFFLRILEEADIGLLLDVNNVYVNAENHGYDARAFIDSLPLERVCQVHLAGHTVEPDVIIDTHGTVVPEPVWELYRHMLERTGPVSTLVEWDQAIPSVDAVLDEADRARSILAEVAA